jgi:hypothetical protein
MSVDETLMCSFKKIKPLDKAKKIGAIPGIKKPTNFAKEKKLAMTKFSR